MSPIVGFRRPKLQQQLNPLDPLGRFGCTAYAAATTGDADTRGALVYTGRQVRAASDEPVPSPASPGLNLVQVDSALYGLSRGAINLDTQFRYPVAKAKADLIAGKWAILQVERGPLVDRGYGGRSPFRLGHAGVFGYDQLQRVPIWGDPLGDWQVATWDDIFAAAGALVLNRHIGKVLGAGLVYAAFSRDVWVEPSQPAPRPKRYSVAFEPGAIYVYSVDGKRAITGRDSREFRRPTSAPCDAPRRYPWPKLKTSRRLVRVRAGGLAGYYVQPGAAHVQLVES